MFLKKFSMVASVTLMSLACLTAAQGDPVTFASFQQGTGGNNFNFNNNGIGSQLQTGNSFHIVVGSIPVHFSYNVGNAYNGFSNASIDATLKMSADVDGLAFQQNTGSPAHPTFTDFQDFKNVSLVFTANTPVGGKSNLLTLLPTTEGTLKGSDGGSTASFSGDTTGGYIVSFSSDFLDFSKVIDRDYSLTFTSLQPALGINGNGYLNSFAATGGGSFASDPPPTSVVPEGISPILLSGGMLPAAVFAFCRRRIRRNFRQAKK